MMIDFPPGTQFEFDQPTVLTVIECVYRSDQSGRALYKVHDSNVGLVYALKVFLIGDGQSIESIRREVVALNRQIQHPDRLPRVRSIQLADRLAFVLMDWMDGVPLDAVTKGTPAVSREDAVLRLGFAAELCRTVGYLHQTRTLHRDLKPQNVLARDARNQRAGVSVLDLGLSVQKRGPVEEGTMGYAAPEQTGQRNLNLGPQTDVFGVGQVLCFLLLGEPLTLYPDDSMRKWSVDVTDLLRTRLHSAVPEPVAALIGRCLALVPEQRPADARALQRLVEASTRK